MGLAGRDAARSSPVEVFSTDRLDLQIRELTSKRLVFLSNEVRIDRHFSRRPGLFALCARMSVHRRASATSDSRTAFRALAKRDMTVPVGIDNMAAISWYDISSTSQSRRVSR